MKNTNIKDTNMILYNSKSEKLNKKEHDEKYFASTAGSLYSCVHDLLIFGKNIKTLLNKDSLDILKKIYLFREDTNSGKFFIRHPGSIYGGNSNVEFRFNKDFVYDDAYIVLETIK
jgi:hypothetical protein